MFNHLHLHTSGSELDGAIKIDKLVDKVIEQGSNAVAITDHGNMIKTYEFYDACKSKGIKPIIGCEMYCGESDDTNYYHLVLLAKNNTGLKNLYKLVHLSYELFYYKPRIALKMLEEHREGLICLSACIGGEVGRNYKDSETKTLEYIEYMKKIFGKDYYLEIQPNSNEEQKDYNKWLESVKGKLGIKCVITCDAHYLEKEDFDSHDTLLCLQTKKKKSDENRMRFPTRDCYVQDELDVRGKLYYLTKETVDEGINSTVEISNKCDVSIEYEDLMPSLPGIADENRELERLCNIGYKKRVSQGAYEGIDKKVVLDRIRYEMSVLREKGYSGYFLIVHDFVNWCKENDIPTGIGRGSVCGSEIPYLLGITEIEPIRYGLFFERFLNPTRNSPPDIDQDICYEKRHLLIQYIKDKYGENSIAHIIAEGSLTVKAVIRKVLSAYGYDMKVIGYYTKLVNDGCNSLRQAIDESEELKEFLETKREFRDMMCLEGLMSHASMHAAGVLIMNDSVDNHFPVRINRKENVAVCEWSKKTIEKLGGFKFDLLGLKQLTIFDKTLKYIERNHGVKLTFEDIYNINLEDKSIYEVLNSGKLKTIFQFTGDSAGAIIAKMKPQCFNDIMVAESISRPGVKEADLYLQNRLDYLEMGDYQKPRYWNLVKDVLEESYGALVYQEQTMLIMNKIAGWSLGKADSMRKVKNLEEYREDFVNGALTKGIPSDIANEIFDRFDLGYSFNKSHACAYGKMSAICAWLLAKYPTEFIASSMTLELTQSESDIKGFVMEAKTLGINILPADINVSTDEFEPYKEGIRIPLTSIKNVGSNVFKAILEVRDKTEILSLEHFLAIVPKSKANKKVVKNLIMAGAFDSLMKNRSELLIKFMESKKEDTSKIFFYCDEVQMMYEKEVYGFALTKHPLDGFKSEDIKSFENGKTATLIGIANDVTLRLDKNNNEMCFATIENQVCEYRAVVFSRTYARFKTLLKKGMKLRLSGKRDGNSILVDKVEVI